MNFRLIITLLLAFQGHYLSAQLSYSYLSDGSLWSVAECNGWPSDCRSIYYTVGDTILVNDTVYNKLHEADSSGKDLGYRYLVRKDSILPRIYIRGEFGIGERLMFDMSYNVGDTIIDEYYNQPVAFVSSVDSITLFGYKRKRINLRIPSGGGGSTSGESWIDGIGSTMGPDGYQYNLSDWGRVLMCYHNNDSLQYIDTNYNTCYWTLSLDNPLENGTALTIFPNPTKNKLNILTNIREIGEYKCTVQNTNGHTCLEFDCREKFTLDVSALESGVYFLVVEISNGQMFRKRFLKQ